MKEFKGNDRGIRLESRGLNDKHVCVQMTAKDPQTGEWYDTGDCFDSYYILETTFLLQEALEYLKQEAEQDSDTKFGFKFK